MVSKIKKTFNSDDNRPVKIFFQDEGRFGRVTSIASSWSPKGKRAIVKKQFIRQYCYVSTALCPYDGENFSMIIPEMNTETMTIFLEELSKYYSAFKIILVVDRASWHTTKNLKQFDNIKFIYLPPYSPELNPVEHVWKYVREHFFIHRYWDTFEDLISELMRVFKKFNLNKTLAKSIAFFKPLILDV